jgi:uncharacterized protein HemX
MITKEEIKKEVDNLPNSLLDEVYSYLKNVSLISKEELSEEENKKRWEEWWDNLNNFSPDFMNERIQPPLEIRENMFD